VVSVAVACLPAAVSLLFLPALFFRSLGELSTHLALHDLFTQSSLSSVCEPLLQAFPFPRTLREVTLHPLSQATVFVYRSCWRWVFSPLLWSFPPSVTLRSFPVPGCWACTFAPVLSGQARLVYLVPGGIPLPPFGAPGIPPSLLLVFIVLIAYYSVSLFSPGWGSVCLGGYADLAEGCLWEYHVPLSSPCLCLPKPSGHGQLAARGPSWFLRLM
jgi:hypothetical protein